MNDIIGGRNLQSELVKTMQLNTGDVKISFYEDGEFLGDLPIDEEVSCTERGVEYIFNAITFRSSPLRDGSEQTAEMNRLLAIITKSSNVIGVLSVKGVIMFTGVPDLSTTGGKSSAIQKEVTRESITISGELASKTKIMTSSQIPPVKNGDNKGGLDFTNVSTVQDLVRQVILRFNRKDAAGNPIVVYAPIVDSENEVGDSEGSDRWKRTDTIGIVNRAGVVQIKVNGKDGNIQYVQDVSSDGTSINRSADTLMANYDEAAGTFLLRHLNQLSINLMTNEFGDFVLYNTNSIPRNVFNLYFDYDNSEMNNTSKWNMGSSPTILPRTIYLMTASKADKNEMPVEWVSATVRKGQNRNIVSYTGITGTNPFSHVTRTLVNKVEAQQVRRDQEQIANTALARAAEFRVQIPTPFLRDSMGKLKKITIGDSVIVHYNDGMEEMANEDGGDNELMITQLSYKFSKNSVSAEVTLRAKAYLSMTDVNFRKGVKKARFLR